MTKYHELGKLFVISRFLDGNGSLMMAMLLLLLLLLLMMMIRVLLPANWPRDDGNDGASDGDDDQLCHVPASLLSCTFTSIAMYPLLWCHVPASSRGTVAPDHAGLGGQTNNKVMAFAGSNPLLG
jgi:hypothetical protein